VQLTFTGKLLEAAGRALLAQTGRSFWMPPRASSIAYEVDWLFYFILIIAVFFFLLIVVLMVIFTLRYRAQEGAGPVGGQNHNTALEITWSVIPVILVAIIFYLGFKSFITMTVAPSNSYEILVTAQKWKWLFTYPNGYTSDDLHVPLEVPVELVMSSEDVIHSFYVPAFRVKRDVVPGRYNKLWFRATQKGQFIIFCAEYCGTGHSDMMSLVVVHDPKEFASWLEDAAATFARKSPAEAGAELYKTRGCTSCHSLDGSRGKGPTFKNLFGSTQPLADGTEVKVDENYVRESIMEPLSKLAAGYEPIMPTYKGRLKDREITSIIEFLKTLTN